MNLWRTRRKEFRDAYEKFHNSFTFFLQQLESGNASLNILILDEFSKHDIATKDFIFFLHGKRKRLFLSKWAEYENKYYEIKNLGIVGAFAAIAPSNEALSNATSNDAENWEYERKINIHKIIMELLEISRIKKWF